MYDEVLSSPGNRGGEVRALIARYPELSANEIADLKRWFRKEASALDVGLLANETELVDQYGQFRHDHIDRFELRDLVNAAIFMTLIIGPIAATVIYMQSV